MSTQTFEQWQAARAGQSGTRPAGARTPSEGSPAPAAHPRGMDVSPPVADPGLAAAPAPTTPSTPATPATPAAPATPPALATPTAEPGLAADPTPAATADALLAQAQQLVRRAEAILAAPRAATPAHDESALVGCVTRAEQMMASLGAVQRRASVAYRDSRIAVQRAAGVRAAHLGRGVAEEIGLARRISPVQAGNQIALAGVLVQSLPRTARLLAQGQISAWAADDVAKAVMVLDDAHRAQVDEDLAPQLPHVTARRAGALARARADELDQETALARYQRAVAQRAVSIRPLSDALVRVSATLPTAEGVAVYAALDAGARRAQAAGDSRTRGQHMADSLVARVTGQESAADLDIELQLLMTDQALLGGEEQTAWLDGTPIPAAIARHLALGVAGNSGGSAAPPGKSTDPPPVTAARRWIRRLYTDPATGELRAADPRRRLFTGEVRRHVLLRDRQCRGPWCDGVIADVHHVQGFSRGGETTSENGVGTCRRLNLAVEMPGWRTRSDEDGALRIVTPTGREYTSRPPALRAPPVPSAAAAAGGGGALWRDSG